VTGSTGSQGAQGNQGFQGVFGGNSLGYTFSSTTTDSDPGSGILRFNNATLASVTKIYIDDLDENATDQQTWIDALDDTSNTTHFGYVRICKQASAAAFAIYEITAANTDPGGYTKLNLAYVTSAGSFSDTDKIFISFSRTGDRGVQGTQGTAGSNGSTGAQGAQGAQGSAGGAGSGQTLLIWMCGRDKAEFPASNYATYNTRNNHSVLEFDTTTGETVYIPFIMPRSYAGGGITVYLTWCAATATSGTIGWLVAVERIGAAQQDIDSDGFAADQTLTAITVDAASGNTTVGNVAFTNGAQMDSVAVGEMFRLRITRNVASDTAAGDAQLLAVEIKET
jgi:hypothetical protein